jgi:transaldolase/glucose-6-phosphate isomerase
MANPIIEATKLGQSVWYDTLGRRMLTSGELRRMIEGDGLRGVTSNPTIFEKAMLGGDDYEASLRAHLAAGVRDPKALYERLAIEDIRAAAELLHPAYLASDRADGFVSMEVSPHLAHDTEGTIAEARRLFREIDRENVMIKVPGTREGVPAIERLTGEGVNVNVTLLFGLDAYRASAEAYTRGLEALLASGGDPHRVAGVASFFLSRIDALVDERIADALVTGPGPERRARIEGLRGKVAIANAKRAYVHYRQITSAERWRALAVSGAHPQRLLWASTGPKNPSYGKTYYVDPLVGPDTVSTVPGEVYAAFLRGGAPRPTLAEGAGEASETLAQLAAVGISLDQVTAELLDKGVRAFSTAFDKLLTGLAQERDRLEAIDAAGSTPATT